MNERGDAREKHPYSKKAAGAIRRERSSLLRRSFRKLL
jgi:hypothetical protein